MPYVHRSSGLEILLLYGDKYKLEEVLYYPNQNSHTSIWLAMSILLLVSEY